MFKNFWGCLKGRLLAYHAYYTVQHDLGKLSDHQLKDIGLTRSEIDHYALRAYYKQRKIVYHVPHSI